MKGTGDGQAKALYYAYTLLHNMYTSLRMRKIVHLHINAFYI